MNIEFGSPNSCPLVRGNSGLSCKEASRCLRPSDCQSRRMQESTLYATPPDTNEIGTITIDPLPEAL